MQSTAVAHVCERFLQHLVDSGVLSQGWRHWPQTWMQEGGEQFGMVADDEAFETDNYTHCVDDTPLPSHQALASLCLYVSKSMCADHKVSCRHTPDPGTLPARCCVVVCAPNQLTEPFFLPSCLLCHLPLCVPCCSCWGVRLQLCPSDDCPSCSP